MKISNSGLPMEDGGSCMPCTSDDEKQIIMELTTAAESNLKEGNLYYVLSNRWFAGWQQYVGQESDESPMDQHFTVSQHLNIFSSKKADRPGPIDNSDLILKESNCEDDDFELRTLEEGLDYVLVPHAVWQKLLEWYKGGPTLPRKLISQGDSCKQFNVEVYLLRLKLTDSRDDSQSIIRLSKKASIQELYKRVCAVRGIKQEKVQVWDFFNKQKHSILATSNHTLEESNLQMDQDILLEVQLEGDIESGLAMGSMKNDLALVPIRAPGSPLTIAGGPILSNYYPNDFPSSLYKGSTLTSTSADLKDGFDSIGTPVKLDRKGLAGLQNLGNTCFMNSAIQCLVHTPPLVEYFLQDYTDKINRDNPLGMHGELALAFGELLRKLWSSGQTAVAPRTFKGKLARFAPQFSGYNQHDSQELLAFLLDGLHEDLNRVKQKPYIEARDSGGRPDEVVAEECWMNHRARNDSLIVDVCQGQYKSTLVCPVCGKVSVTFDPFMYLSLPLPSTATRTVTVTVFYGDGTGLPMPYTVTVSRLGCCKDLVRALGVACCLNMDESLLLAEVHENCIYRYLENPSELLSCIKDDEHIIAYRLPKNHSGLTKVELLHRCLESSKLLGAPLVAYIDEPQTAADIYSAVERAISPLRRKSFIGSAKVHGGKRNGIVSEAVDKQIEKCVMDVGTQNHSEEASSGIFPFQLSTTDERGLGKVIEKGLQLKPGQTARVVLDWSKREHELYDASYLRDLPEVCKAVFSVKKTRQEAISLFSCLETFLREEPLGPDDMWYCPNCKEHRQATKKLDLWRLPDILVFHLKRFSYSRYLKNKLDAFVSFPIHDLDLSKYVKCKDVPSKSHVYQLYAISNHYGGLGGGHYSAYAKLIDENRWYHFDDSHVSPVSEEDVRSPAAYVLFYQAKAAAGSIDQTSSPSPPLYGG